MWIACDPTTVTVVPIAARVVIFVVANAVSFVLWENARTFDACYAGILFMHICTVKTFALFAVFVTFGATTVSSVPSAAGIVVSIITSVVALPSWLATDAFDFTHTFVTSYFIFTVQALAFCAELELVGLAIDTTTIPVVPGTSGVIVTVIAEAIPDKLFCTAISLDFLGASIAFVLKNAIQALAFLAICVVIFIPTAISSIPIATSIVVIVVTSFVSLPKRLRTL